MMIICHIFMCILLVSIVQLHPNNIMKLPFTFDVKNFSNEFLQLDPDGCGKQFSIGFSVNDDFHSDGDILLNITFVHPSGIFIYRRKNKWQTQIPTTNSLNSKWFRPPCLHALRIHSLDESGKSILVKQVGRFVTDKLLSFNVTIPDSISKTRFITVDGDVAITNAHCIGIYSEVDVVGIYRRMEFIEYVDNHLSSDIPVIGNIASFVRQATDLIVGLFGRPVRTSTEAPITKAYIGVEKRDEHRQGIKLLRVPSDFAKRYYCKLMITVRPIGETSARSIYIRVRDKYNKIDFAFVHLFYRGIHKYELGCFIHTGDKMKQMSHGQFTNDDYKLNFPIRPEFVAMIVFHFVKEEPIKLFINSVHYCTFEPLNTKEIPHRVTFEPEKNHLSILSVEWI